MHKAGEKTWVPPGGTMICNVTADVMYVRMNQLKRVIFSLSQCTNFNIKLQKFSGSSAPKPLYVPYSNHPALKFLASPLTAGRQLDGYCNWLIFTAERSAIMQLHGSIVQDSQHQSYSVLQHNVLPTFICKKDCALKEINCC